MRNTRWLNPAVLMIVFAAIAACGQDARLEEEQVNTAEQAVSTCSDLDEFTPLPGWRNLVTDPAYAGLIVGGNDITAALQAAVNNLKQPATSTTCQPTLYIPPGVWTMNKTVTLPTNVVGVNIVGADPATTKITWTGAVGPACDVLDAGGQPSAALTPADIDMFQVYDLVGLKFGRLTLDGANRARIGVHVFRSTNGAVPGPTGYEFNDDVFQNLKYGIVGGAYTYSDIQALDGSVTEPACYLNPRSGSAFIATTTSDVGDMLIRRSRFDKMAETGVLMATDNAINWLIDGSEFSNSHRGITVVRNSATVINNRFISNGTDCLAEPDKSKHQGGGDIWSIAQMFMVVRGNYSSGSVQFLLNRPGGGVVPTDVTGNYISIKDGGCNYRSDLAGGVYQKPAIHDQGDQMTLFDNYIETNAPATNLAVRMLFPNKIAHGGNFFLTSNPVCNASTASSFIHTDSSADDLPVGGDQCATVAPATYPAKRVYDALALNPVKAAPLSDRTVLNVSQPLPGSTTVCTLQALQPPPGNLPNYSCDIVALNAWLSVQSTTSRQLLYFPAAAYLIDQPIKIPGSLDISFAGDGNKTQLWWSGTDTTVVDPYLFQIASPARASIRDMSTYFKSAGITKAGGIRIDSGDDIGGLVYIDTFATSWGGKSSIDMVGLDSVLVRADLSGGFGGERFLGVIGGGNAAPWQGGSSGTMGLRMFGGGAGSNASLIELKNWGKAVLVGVDNEASPQGMMLNQSGYLSLAHGRFLPTAQSMPTVYADQPNIVAQSTFRGRVTLMGLSLSAKIVAASAPEANVLSLHNFYEGSWGAGSSHQPVLPSCPSTAAAMPIACGYTTFKASSPIQMELQNDGRCVPTALYTGTTSSCNDQAVSAAKVSFAAAMLADDRAADTLPPTACAQTAVRIHRLTMEGSSISPMGTGIRVQRY